uniref:Uncharacterized protein n=1 Tax=Rhipicephalus zambeziensis TaxID=60191 RepID=A0A224YJP8_9ACAR
MLILGTHPESQHPSGVQGRFSNVEGEQGRNACSAEKNKQTNKNPDGFNRQPAHALHTHCETFLNLAKLFLALCLRQSKKTSSRTTKTGK